MGPKMMNKISFFFILTVIAVIVHNGDAIPSNINEEQIAEMMQTMINNRLRSKRSTDVSYYLCLSTTSSQCDSSCNGQCVNKNSFDKTFEQDGKCYRGLASGSCPDGDNTCALGFRCDCDVEEITCD